MFHFVIGLLIVIVILAVPALRYIALGLIAIAAVGIGVIYLNEQNARHPSVEKQRQACDAFKQAQKEADERDEKSKHAIKPDQIDIRGVVGMRSAINSSAIGSGLIATVKNNAPQATLFEIALHATLHDCPAGSISVTPICDQIGEFSTSIFAEVPPGQVRQMSSRSSDEINNLPPLRGQLMLSYTTKFLRGAVGELVLDHVNPFGVYDACGKDDWPK